MLGSLWIRAHLSRGGFLGILLSHGSFQKPDPFSFLAGFPGVQLRSEERQAEQMAAAIGTTVGGLGMERKGVVPFGCCGWK